MTMLEEDLFGGSLGNDDGEDDELCIVDDNKYGAEMSTAVN